MSADKTTDPYRQAVEAGQIEEEIKRLKAEIRRHAGNVVEAYAYAVNCPRHLPHMRGCAFAGGSPCACRAAVAARWPEYANG